MFAQPRHDRRRFLGMAALSLGAAWIGTRDSVMHMITVKPFRPSSASDLASLDGATAWLNSPPLTATELQGRVVLVDFWTYTCINWLRTLPHIRAWAARYSGAGAGRHRRAYPRIHVRGGHRQRSKGCTGERRYVPDRHRQQPRDLEWVWQSLLASALRSTRVSGSRCGCER